ncbi:hypothetical protein Kpol_1029p21 [Vanderwaltozyma polyspora DSM 70294]|uniref:Kynureninase n=1 Tax=Vanderwaltozyma polyspora (strain ATCC 22028 / DSM 70294 / BCRC 21397 / CBS 2163 / NBRC 10782 / NRRL Y-8283 / UCD 57-17) TaxID=436907 RepID=KYNU_VANPO|nr:uncharacterized protein Kpol_1029p21 [Vanderwaltozyma polyspora DSM 70294]A7TR79.1 RecName: Full=Kynureninase; AltName: Full=Biosynthesis of nicotinic acid protein 5; AltName: Full=L-kynurenine hydrolase [Vanderwaltozyma polyspora DSM 70294]EDO15247.1 hypothetical protein Kpol_1029p21 [Vanderwaltozyma polyspora DSM 70294]
MGIPVNSENVNDETEGDVAGKEVYYLCGNSLGLMPKDTKETVTRELDAWRDRAVESHFKHPTDTSWVDIDLPVVPLLAPIVGGKNEEVAVMNTLTANLNSLLVSFYRPTKKRFKIVFEKKAFPSDYYAFYNQCRLHNFDPNECILQISARPNETFLRTEDILKVIEENNESIALVCLPGIQYYSGQLFEIERITKFAHQYPEIIVGWDLAHAVGNVPLKLHDWGVDFACWCSYKYLNSGPGSIGGLFIHEKWHHSALKFGDDVNHDEYRPRLAGWWGNNNEKRFQMLEKFEPIKGALGFRQSNPSVLDVVCLQSSLKIFQKYGGVENLRLKSLKLTKYLINQLQKSPYYHPKKQSSKEELGFRIITPIQNESQYGAQISIQLTPSRLTGKNKDTMEIVFEYMHRHGVVVDERKPNVIRISPVPLYNTFQDVFTTVAILNSALDSVKKSIKALKSN